MYQVTRRHIPEECNLYSHCRQNLKSHTLKYVHTSCKCSYFMNGTFLSLHQHSCILFSANFRKVLV